MKEIIYTPIGVYHSDQKNPYEAGRQPDELHAPGLITLTPGNNFEQALTGLEGFSHLWIIFQFHHNENWKPMISPPRGTTGKVGVFASRAPYRPNNIGMSLVRLEKIQALNIFVTEADLLDGSPILDIKPYLAYADSRPEASEGWLAEAEKFAVSFSAKAQKQLNWLSPHLTPLKAFIVHQLEYEPTNGKKKRVKKSNNDTFVLAYRTWRIEFQLKKTQVIVERLFSGYSEADLQSLEDPYQDKNLHREFLKDIE